MIICWGFLFKSISWIHLNIRLARIYFQDTTLQIIVRSFSQSSLFPTQNWRILVADNENCRTLSRYSTWAGLRNKGFRVKSFLNEARKIPHTINKNTRFRLHSFGYIYTHYGKTYHQALEMNSKFRTFPENNDMRADYRVHLPSLIIFITFCCPRKEHKLRKRFLRYRTR